MEIRNALKKIDNYLSVVQNLNKTILEEGTMAPDELKLMKKYLRGCIERIEDIELKLNITEPTPVEVTTEQPELITEPENNNEEPAFSEETQPEIQEEVILEETVLTMETQQIIIDPEQTRNERTEEPEMTELPLVETVVVTEETIVTPETVVTTTTIETTTAPAFNLVAKEDAEEPVMGQEEKRTWADLWEDEKAPVNNGLVTEEEEVMSMIVEVKPVVETTTQQQDEIQQPLVVLEEETEEVVQTIVAIKEETTLNDIVQPKKETGLFEMFSAAQEEVAPLKTYTSETSVETMTETEVMVAELDSKEPEFSVSTIFEKVRTGSEERVKSAKTLSESIALNDKFIFVRELFGNQFNEYENALRALEQLGSLGDAEQYCRQHLQEKFKWNDRPANAEKFFTILEKRFAA